MDKFFFSNKQMFNLANLKVNKTAKIIGFKNDLNYKIKKRLLEVGFVNNVLVKLINVSFLNEVMLFELNGYLICIRKDIARKIICSEEKV